MSAAIVREPDFERPIRGELFSTERLEQYAEALAGGQRERHLLHDHLLITGRANPDALDRKPARRALQQRRQ